MPKHILPETARSVISTLEMAGFSAFVVGGYVREVLRCQMPETRDKNIGRVELDPNIDIDIATSATPEQVKAAFADNPNVGVVETGIKHGTVTLVFYEDERNRARFVATYETTTFRRDGDYTDHRRPERVEFTSDITDDLSRRDFTVNAMATRDFAQIIDPFGGAEDLKNGVIRCVGDPVTRFEEDGLRILRALRFASRLDFSIDPPTREALFRCAALLRHISRERLSVELIKLLSGVAAPRITREYAEVLRVAFSGFVPLSEEGARMLAGASFDAEIALAFVFDDPNAVSYESLRRSKTLTSHAQFLIRHKRDTPPSNYKQAATLLYEHGREKGELLLKLLGTERFIAEIAEKKVPVTLAELDVNGSDLQKRGVPSRQIGKELDKMLREKINNHHGNLEFIDLAKGQKDIKFDANYHIHTTHSDGEDSVAEVADKLAALGVKSFSITDHDSVMGNYEARPLAAQYGVRYVDGVELTCCFDGEIGLDITYNCHIVGLDFDLEAMREKLREIAGRKTALVGELFAVLIADGYWRDNPEVRGRVMRDRKTIGRELIAAGYAANMDEAFAKILNAPKYCKWAKNIPTVRQGVEIIHECGGIAVWAHPFGVIRGGKKELTVEQVTALSEYMLSYKIDAVEVFYNKYDLVKIEQLRGLALKMGLPSSVATDYHMRGEGLRFTRLD